MDVVLHNSGSGERRFSRAFAKGFPDLHSIRVVGLPPAWLRSTSKLVSSSSPLRRVGRRFSGVLVVSQCFRRRASCSFPLAVYCWSALSPGSVSPTSVWRVRLFFRSSSDGECSESQSRYEFFVGAGSVRCLEQGFCSRGSVTDLIGRDSDGDSSSPTCWGGDLSRLLFAGRNHKVLIWMRLRVGLGVYWLFELRGARWGFLVSVSV